MRAAGGLICWVLCVAGGMAQLERYSAAPGEGAQAPDRWPAGSALELDAERPTLLVFVHPRCPCSRATLSELARLTANRRGRAEVVVSFTIPPGHDAAWAATDLWRHARAIPGVRARRDVGGAEARRFGARTSGHALLYGPQGELLFSGGLTASRGHEGDNLGRASLEALLVGEPAREASPVFGCPLSGDDPTPTRAAGACCEEEAGHEPSR